MKQVSRKWWCVWGSVAVVLGLSCVCQEPRLDDVHNSCMYTPPERSQLLVVVADLVPGVERRLGGSRALDPTSHVDHSAVHVPLGLGVCSVQDVIELELGIEVCPLGPVGQVLDALVVHEEPELI